MEFHEYLRTIFSTAISFSTMGVVMEYWSISWVVWVLCITMLLQIEVSLQQILLEAHDNSQPQAHFCYGQKRSYTKHHWEESKKGLHGDMIVGAEAKRFTRELCTQGFTKGGNDINWLALHNKGTQSACSSSTSWKEPNNITSCYLKNNSHGHAASKELKKSNI
jgi:hypothetical protein